MSVQCWDNKLSALMLLFKAFIVVSVLSRSEGILEDNSQTVEWTTRDSSEETTSEPLFISPYVSLIPLNNGLPVPSPVPQLPSNSNTLSVSPSKIETFPVTESSIFSWDIILTLVLPYSIIFVLAVVGNILVIVTLTLNRSMRSVTNIFLLNLAIADFLLGVFCMPFTLVGQLLRRFIFGNIMCHLISYMQSVSVAVSVWTLVIMSIERYYAICQPLRSRHRQSRKFAYRLLALVWALAITLMLPTAIVTELQVIKQTGNYKCREAWPSFSYKEAFTIMLIAILLVLPLLIMIITYTSIAVRLKKNLRRNTTSCSTKRSTKKRFTTITTTLSDEKDSNIVDQASQARPRRSLFSSTSSTATTLSSVKASRARTKGTSVQLSNHTSCSPVFTHQTLRVNSNETIQARQRRVIVMLFVVVCEFFICWTPIFVVDTLALYMPGTVYGASHDIDIISACHLY